MVLPPGEKRLVLYAPDQACKKIREIADKYDLSVSKLLLYSALETVEYLEKIGAGQNVGILDFKKKVKTKIKEYHNHDQIEVKK